MFRRFPLTLFPAVFVALMVTTPALKAETNVRIQLERMLTSEETSKRGIPLGKKIEIERPFLTCQDKQASISMFVALFHGDEQIMSKASGKLACGGKRTKVSSDEVVGILNSTIKEMQGNSKEGDSFLPGDQFLGKTAFNTEAYKEGSIVRPLSKELRIDLSSKTWYVITAVDSSGSQKVKSNPWVILANETIDGAKILGGY